MYNEVWRLYKGAGLQTQFRTVTMSQQQFTNNTRISLQIPGLLENEPFFAQEADPNFDQTLISFTIKSIKVVPWFQPMVNARVLFFWEGFFFERKKNFWRAKKNIRHDYVWFCELLHNQTSSMADFFTPAASYFPLGFTTKLSELQKKNRACGAHLAIASLGKFSEIKWTLICSKILSKWFRKKSLGACVDHWFQHYIARKYLSMINWFNSHFANGLAQTDWVPGKWLETPLIMATKMMIIEHDYK